MTMTRDERLHQATALYCRGLAWAIGREEARLEGRPGKSADGFILTREEVGLFGVDILAVLGDYARWDDDVRRHRPVTVWEEGMVQVWTQRGEAGRARHPSEGVGGGERVVAVQYTAVASEHLLYDLALLLADAGDAAGRGRLAGFLFWQGRCVEDADTVRELATTPEACKALRRELFRHRARCAAPVAPVTAGPQSPRHAA